MSPLQIPATPEDGIIASSSLELESLMSKLGMTTNATTNTDSYNTSSGNKDSFIVGNNSIEKGGTIINAAGGINVMVHLGQRESVKADGSSRNSQSNASITPESLPSPLPSTPSMTPTVIQNDIPAARHPSIDRVRFSESDVRGAETYSIAPNSKSRLTRIQGKDIKALVLGKMHKGIVSYMGAEDLFKAPYSIPLWKPSPSLVVAEEVENWARNVYIGDVGVFDDNGGFETYFNIFETEEQNRRRHYTPPGNFIPYHKRLSEMFIDIEPRRAISKDQLQLAGFERDTRVRKNDLILRLPSNFSRSQSYAAIHMREGYTRIALQSQDDSGIKQYCRCNQTSWYESLHEILNGRRLAIITASYRTQAWASASVKSPNSKTTVELIQQTINGEKTSFWSSTDNSVLTKNGPSPDHIDRKRTYLQKISDIPNLMEIEECHVVAVEAYCLEEGSAGWGPLSTIGRRASRQTQNTVKPRQASVFSFLTSRGWR